MSVVLIGCRRCHEPNCRGCNLYALEVALTLGRFDGLMDEHHAVHINADVVERPRWIPVTERLPEEWESVYAAVRSDGREDWVIEVGVYDPYLSCPWGHIPMLESGKATVYAWMPRPLPEPPKEVAT